MFSEILKRTLKSSGRNQKELAEFVGVKQNTVSDWINKGTSPKIEHLYRISDFFGISFDTLFGKQLTDDLQNNNFDISNSYNSLTEHQKTTINNIILEYEELNNLKK